MDKTIDCLFIGHNEMSLREQETQLRITAKKNSVEYREFNTRFISYANNNYTASDLFNQFFYNENLYKDDFGPIKMFSGLFAAITYLGSYLAKRGFSIDYVNLFRAHKGELAEKLSKNNIRCIAIPTTFYTNPYPVKEIIQFVRRYNNTAKIVLGGPYILYSIKTTPGEAVQDFLRYMGADFYIHSTEGEAALAGIVNAVKNGLSYEDINNIFYWDGTEYKITAEIPENNMEDVSLDWSLFSNTAIDTVYLRTARSCPFSCAFCEFPAYAGNYRASSVEYIEKILDDIKKVGTVNRIWFIDDTFNVPVERFKEILRMIIKNKYKFTWHSNLRCQFADRETVELMKESGCENVFLGIESGSQKILDNMNKNVNVEQYLNGISLLNEYEITNTASFIVGFPGETHETYLETKNFIEESKPTFYKAGMWAFLPLSAIGKRREEFNLTGSHYQWSHATMDSNKARDLDDELSLTVANSIRLRIFDDGIYQMKRRGLSLEQVKKFHTFYNEALADKIKDPKNKEMRPEIAEKLRQVCIKTL